LAASHESRPVRIEAYEAMGRAYGGLAEVVAACWDSTIADRLVDDRLRGRDHPAAATLEDQDLPPAAFTSLLDAIAGSHPALQAFLRRRAGSLGVEKLHPTDVSANPPGAGSIAFDDAWETSLAALRAL